MKYVCLTFLLLWSISTVYSQSSAPGYYITKDKDTIITQIKLERGVFNQIRNDFSNEIEILNDKNEVSKFTAEDIGEYGFALDNIQYRFFSKPTYKGTNKFLVPVIIGPKSSLYQYGISTTSSMGSMSSNQVFYTFEKADGTYLFLKNILNKKFRTELKEFYKDSKEAQSIIDTKLKYWLELQKDLILILNAVNNK